MRFALLACVLFSTAKDTEKWRTLVITAKLKVEQ